MILMFVLSLLLVRLSCLLFVSGLGMGCVRILFQSRFFISFGLDLYRSSRGALASVTM